MKEFLAVSLLFAATSGFAMGKTPTPAPIPSPSLSPSVPPQPVMTLKTGVYHDVADDSVLSCSVEIRISSDRQTIFLTKVTNYQSAYYCDGQGDSSRYDLTLTADNKWEFIDADQDVFVATGDAEFEIENTYQNLFFSRVADAPIRAQHFENTTSNAWYRNEDQDICEDVNLVNINSAGPGQCMLGDGSLLPFSQITQEDVQKDGLCERATRDATDTVMNECAQAGYTQCVISHQSAQIIVNGTEPVSNWAPATGCVADVLVDGR
jgi:hypothetical protein